MKDFDGGFLKIAAANSAANLRSDPVAVLLLDEIDGYPDDVDGEGDPLIIAARRLDAFAETGETVQFLGSTPVPFSSKFSHGPLISDTLGAVLGDGELHIAVSGISEYVVRPYLDVLKLPTGGEIRFLGMPEFVRVPTNEGTDAAIGWVLHHEYKGAIPLATVKGLRLRTGNIQIGGSDLVQECFKEPRFNSWSVGEIHTIDPRLIPNGRRDHFEQNIHFENLINHIADVAREIGARCRASSSQRNWISKFDQFRGSIEDKMRVIAQGAVGQDGVRLLSAEAEVDLEELRKIANKECLSPELRVQLSAEIDRLSSASIRSSRASKVHRNLRRLSAMKRNVYEHAFQLIYKHCEQRVIAHRLVESMLHDLRTHN